MFYLILQLVLFAPFYFIWRCVMSQLVLAGGFGVGDNFDLNDLYIQQGGYNWSRYMSYEGYIIYKDTDSDYYQIRKFDNNYICNSKSLAECKKIINELDGKG